MSAAPRSLRARRPARAEAAPPWRRTRDAASEVALQFVRHHVRLARRRRFPPAVAGPEATGLVILGKRGRQKPVVGCLKRLRWGLVFVFCLWSERRGGDRLGVRLP